MRFTEIKEAVEALSAEQRVELQEHLQALEEGISVEELRAINAALDEELTAPSEGLTIEQVRQNIDSLKPGDVP